MTSDGPLRVVGGAGILIHTFSGNYDADAYPPPPRNLASLAMCGAFGSTLRGVPRWRAGSRGVSSAA